MNSLFGLTVLFGLFCIHQSYSAAKDVVAPGPVTTAASSDGDGKITIVNSDVPNAAYASDAVECLSEAYNLSEASEYNSISKLFAQLYQQKHSWHKWNVIAKSSGYYLQYQYRVVLHLNAGGEVDEYVLFCI